MADETLNANQVDEEEIESKLPNSNTNNTEATSPLITPPPSHASMDNLANAINADPNKLVDQIKLHIGVNRHPANQRIEINESTNTLSLAGNLQSMLKQQVSMSTESTVHEANSTTENDNEANKFDINNQKTNLNLDNECVNGNNGDLLAYKSSENASSASNLSDAINIQQLTPLLESVHLTATDANNQLNMTNLNCLQQKLAKINANQTNSLMAAITSSNSSSSTSPPLKSNNSNSHNGISSTSPTSFSQQPSTSAILSSSSSSFVSTNNWNNSSSSSSSSSNWQQHQPQQTNFKIPNLLATTVADDHVGASANVSWTNSSESCNVQVSPTSLASASLLHANDTPTFTTDTATSVSVVNNLNGQSNPTYSTQMLKSTNMAILANALVRTGLMNNVGKLSASVNGQSQRLGLLEANDILKGNTSLLNNQLIELIKRDPSQVETILKLKSLYQIEDANNAITNTPNSKFIEELQQHLDQILTSNMNLMSQTANLTNSMSPRNTMMTNNNYNHYQPHHHHHNHHNQQHQNHHYNQHQQQYQYQQQHYNQNLNHFNNINSNNTNLNSTSTGNYTHNGHHNNQHGHHYNTNNNFHSNHHKNYNGMTMMMKNHNQNFNSNGINGSNNGMTGGKMNSFQHAQMLQYNSNFNQNHFNFGQQPHQYHDCPEERFSRKVFCGGLPPDIDEDEIVTHFRRYGKLVVDWPHKAESKSYFPPKGYAFLIFNEERHVQDLVETCHMDDEKLYMVVSSPSMKDKPVQIRPWCLADSDFVMDGSQPLDPRKTIFVGGVPRPLRAIELAMIMDRLYGGVCYAGIDTDPELKYPKGAGYVAFSNKQSYIAAISARFVQMHHGEIDKRVEIKPYVLDDQACDECHGARCGGRFAPFFCANVTCLQYYCEACWTTIHSRPGREYHKPLVKEGADRPRPIQYKSKNRECLD